MTNLKQRNIIVMVLLYFFTCGIYPLYWLFVGISELNRELIKIYPQRKMISPVKAFFLSFITCGIYMLFAAYNWSQGVRELGDYYNVQTHDPTLVFLFWVFIGIAPFLMQSDMNKIANTKQ